MDSINHELTQRFAKKTVWIYTDGGASTHRHKTGAYAAMILFPDDTKVMVAGACAWTKINRMELTAFNAALYYIWAIHYERITHGISIHIISDSEVTVNGATTGKLGPDNEDLWLQFDSLCSHFDSLSANHMSRNEEPAQRQADAACHIFRTEFETLFEAWVNHPGFETLELTVRIEVMVREQGMAPEKPYRQSGAELKAMRTETVQTWSGCDGSTSAKAEANERSPDRKASSLPPASPPNETDPPGGLVWSTPDRTPLG